MSAPAAFDPAVFDPARPCELCPRACRAVRTQTPGFCGGGAALRVALTQLHHGEEPPISGQNPERGGSGTIFFSGCALKCAYCQNHAISFGPEGASQPPGHDLPHPDDLAALMLELQLSGAHNVNLVTAGHYAPLVRQALLTAKGAGLAIPVVWNSSGYERVDTLRTLEGLVDIYLPDLRYMDARAAARYSAAPDYPKAATFAICEMRRQAGGGLVIDEATGLATRGLLIRLLVLPGNAGRTDLALEWIADTLGPDTPVSLMGQYYPTHRAADFPEINRAVAPEEYAAVRRRMEELGFSCGYVQEVGSSEAWTPDFATK
jgi:putative pyruvate formate lyase activating enzyme